MKAMAASLADSILCLPLPFPRGERRWQHTCLVFLSCLPEAVVGLRVYGAGRDLFGWVGYNKIPVLEVALLDCESSLQLKS